MPRLEPRTITRKTVDAAAHACKVHGVVHEHHATINRCRKGKVNKLTICKGEPSPPGSTLTKRYKVLLDRDMERQRERNRETETERGDRQRQRDRQIWRRRYVWCCHWKREDKRTQRWCAEACQRWAGRRRKMYSQAETQWLRESEFTRFLSGESA